LRRGSKFQPYRPPPPGLIEEEDNLVGQDGQERGVQQKGVWIGNVTPWIVQNVVLGRSGGPMPSKRNFERSEGKRLVPLLRRHMSK
jgi:hypothetical protein